MIGIGIGGWVFEPWRGSFYPPKLPQARELAHASRRMTAIEINGTFYRTQNPATFRKWRDETPEGFVFSLKGPRYATNRKVLADAGPSIHTFLASGLTELGDRLGPINWQLAPTKAFDAEDFARFLDRLPSVFDGVALRHAVELRHESFVCAEAVGLARERGIAIVLADSDDHPLIADPTADFVYARLQRSRAEAENGYDEAALDLWADRIAAWQAGRSPKGLPRLGPKAPAAKRDVFVFFISGEKVRNPAAAEALIRRIS